jgi:anti-anti-sigma factor
MTTTQLGTSGALTCGWSAVGSCVIVRVGGEVDDVTAPTLESELRRVITTKQPTVVVDLRRVGFMNSTGIRVLAVAHELAVEQGGWLRLACADEQLTKLLRLTGLDSRIELYPALADALPSYRRSTVGR